MLNKNDEIIDNSQTMFDVTARDVPRVTEIEIIPIQTTRSLKALLITLITISTLIVIGGLILILVYGLDASQNLGPAWPSDTNNSSFSSKSLTTNQIGWFKGAPDGFTRQILGINGNFPQVLRYKKGDRIIFDIQNMAENKTMMTYIFTEYSKKRRLQWMV